MKLLLPTGLLALMPIAAFAHDGMHVNDAFARSTNPVTAAIFMQLENHRDVACTLQGVTSDAAERVELHTHAEEDGVMRMGKIEGGIEIPAGEAHEMMRGADHVMMMGLTAPLKDGDQVAFTLDFGDCGTVDVDAVVDNERGAMDHGDGHDAHAGH
ncbi:copper chaperone PCu(A)C [Paracoccus sp. 1_MG-2023]|uniref:copper chaperone PCu(A)C n=1 Tax=unclassified Paracoccus (in: a-proteobacteria) TaxID=2688777 RepID=UPI001C089C90|nr:MULTISPECIES: copper chaperone PCu(A)C [unclassified Paracoccus (in: a-proteobacteria)]MBU2957098.1 copper chaperone PCu(A)C [Paracoccus sp. C2R09]MDO6669568.1 copper chaperone PCu(A)C [Paracoccus sp. 1_MG-2023]